MFQWAMLTYGLSASIAINRTVGSERQYNIVEAGLCPFVAENCSSQVNFLAVKHSYPRLFLLTTTLMLLFGLRKSYRELLGNLSPWCTLAVLWTWIFERGDRPLLGQYRAKRSQASVQFYAQVNREHFEVRERNTTYHTSNNLPRLFGPITIFAKRRS